MDSLEQLDLQARMKKRRLRIETCFDGKKGQIVF